jgi:hypothetical protein
MEGSARISCRRTRETLSDRRYGKERLPYLLCPQSLPEFSLFQQLLPSNESFLSSCAQRFHPAWVDGKHSQDSNRVFAEESFNFLGYTWMRLAGASENHGHVIRLFGVADPVAYGAGDAFRDAGERLVAMLQD